MSASKPPFFFSSSQSVDDQLGRIFSFLWASYAGLRELWWQVRGFKTNFPELTLDDVKKKFFSGLTLPGEIDLNQICLETNWIEHEEEFTKWLLFDACTLYEAWAEEVCSLIFDKKIADSCAKQIQFPGSRDSKGNPKGFLHVIELANKTPSTFIKTQFFPNLKSGKFNKWTNINEFLLGYRYFKECRNTIIHSDGLATKKLIDTQKLFLDAIGSEQKLDRYVFNIKTHVIGDKITLNIKDVILFTRIIKILISTFDTALCIASTCESILEDRLRVLVSKNSKWQILPADSDKRLQRIHRMISASKIPEPISIGSVDNWMKSKKIIH